MRGQIIDGTWVGETAVSDLELGSGYPGLAHHLQLWLVMTGSQLTSQTYRRKVTMIEFQIPYMGYQTDYWSVKSSDSNH